MMGQDVLFLCQKFITVVVFRYQKTRCWLLSNWDGGHIFIYIYIYSICLYIYIFKILEVSNWFVSETTWFHEVYVCIGHPEEAPIIVRKHHSFWDIWATFCLGTRWPHIWDWVSSSVGFAMNVMLKGRLLDIKPPQDLHRMLFLHKFQWYDQGGHSDETKPCRCSDRPKCLGIFTRCFQALKTPLGPFEPWNVKVLSPKNVGYTQPLTIKDKGR